MSQRIVYVFGNPDLPGDALPIYLLPQLSERFPALMFNVRDPNEDWDIPDDLIVLDTVVGIDRVTLFEGLDAFTAAPHVSVHDFDAYANLRLLQKLGRLKRVHIIGIPSGMEKGAALSETTNALKGFLPL